MILILPLLLMTATSFVSCANMQQLEQMQQREYENWKLYIQLGVKVTANRLLEEGSVTADELNLVANVVDSVATSPVVPGATALITPALEKAGLTSDEIRLVIAIVEQELLARGALEWLDPTTGVVSLSPRTKEILGLVAGSLRSAASVNRAEVQEAQFLETEFQGGLVRQ